MPSNLSEKIIDQAYQINSALGDINHQIHQNIEDAKSANRLQEIEINLPRQKEKTMPFVQLLIDSARNGNNDGVLTALRNNVDINVVRNNCNYTALHYAATAGHSETVQLLIERGANVNARGINGVTPLHFAAQCGDVATGSALLNNGAETEATTRCASTPQNDGETPLHWAAFGGRDDFIKLLLDRGANYKALRNDNKNPAQRAIDNNKKDTARLIKNYHQHIKSRALNQRLVDFQNNMLQVNRLEQEIAQLGTCLENKNLEIEQLNGYVNRLTNSRARFFKPTTEAIYATSAALLVMAVMLAVDGEQILDNKTKFVGKIAASIVLSVLTYLFTQRLTSVLNIAGQRLDEFSNALIETTKSGNEAIREFTKLTTPINTAINDLRNNTNRLTERMVALVDAGNNTIVSLKGNATQVADALDFGIRAGKFQPQANVNVSVDVHDNKLDASLLRF